MRIGAGVLELIGAAPRFIALLGRLMVDRRVSVADRAIVAAAVAYAFSPIDLVPDFIPVLGQLDDVYLIALAVDRMLRRADPDVVRAHWKGSAKLLDTFETSLGRATQLIPQAVERELAHSREGR